MRSIWLLRCYDYVELLSTTLAVDPTMPGTLYALSNQGGVFKSTDDGMILALQSTTASTATSLILLTTLTIDPTDTNHYLR